VTLLAFVAERRAAAPLLLDAWRPPLSIYTVQGRIMHLAGPTHFTMPDPDTVSQKKQRH